MVAVIFSVIATWLLGYATTVA